MKDQEEYKIEGVYGEDASLVPLSDAIITKPDTAGDTFVVRTESISNLVSQNIEIVNRVLDVAGQITDVYRESQQLSAKVEVIKEYGKVELAKTAAKFQTTKKLIEETFGERGEALKHYYKVLDSAIENGNEDMILKAMQMIGSIVVTSPLAQIQEFVKAFETNGQPLLDF